MCHTLYTMAQEQFTQIIKIELDQAAIQNSRKQVQDLTKEIKKLSDAQKDLKDQGKDLTKEYKDITARQQDLGKALKDNTRVLQQANAALEAQEKAIAGNSEELKENKAEIEAVRRSMGDFKQAMVDAISSGEKFDDVLGDMQEELAKMALAGKEGTEEYLNLAQAIAEVQDISDDAKEHVAALSSESIGLDAMVETVEGLSGAFTVAQDAMKALGIENEGLEEGITRVNSALDAMKGLQQLANTFLGEGAAKTLLMNGAQQAYTLVVGTSTGALKAFKLALAATGIGLAVVAVGALAANWDKVEAAMSSVSKEQKEFNKVRKDTLADTAKELGNVERLIDEYGESNTQSNRRNEILKELNTISPTYFKNLDSELTTLGDLKQAYIDYGDAVEITSRLKAANKIIDDAAIERLELEAQTIEDLVTTGDQLISFFSGATGAGAVDPNIEAETLAIERQNKALEDNAKKTEFAKEQAKKAHEELKQLGGPINDNDDKGGNDKVFDQLQSELTARVENLKAQLAATEENSAEQLELRKKLIKAQLQLDLKAQNDRLVNETEAEEEIKATKTRLTAEANNEITALNKAFQLQQDELNDAEEEKEKQKLEIIRQFSLERKGIIEQEKQNELKVLEERAELLKTYGVDTEKFVAEETERINGEATAKRIADTVAEIDTRYELEKNLLLVTNKITAESDEERVQQVQERE